MPQDLFDQISGDDDRPIMDDRWGGREDWDEHRRQDAKLTRKRAIPKLATKGKRRS